MVEEISSFDLKSRLLSTRGLPFSGPSFALPGLSTQSATQSLSMCEAIAQSSEGAVVMTSQEGVVSTGSTMTAPLPTPGQQIQPRYKEFSSSILHI